MWETTIRRGRAAWCWLERAGATGISHSMREGCVGIAYHSVTLHGREYGK